MRPTRGSRVSKVGSDTPYVDKYVFGLRVLARIGILPPEAIVICDLLSRTGVRTGEKFYLLCNLRIFIG